MKQFKTLLFAFMLLTMTATAQDTVRNFKAPITIRIGNDTIATKIFGRLATASNMVIDWKMQEIVVNWKVSYFDPADSSVNVDAFMTPYSASQTANNQVYVNGATGENIALTTAEFLNSYGVKDTSNTDLGEMFGYKKTANGNPYFIGTPTNNIMDGWSAYMYFSTQPTPLRNLVMSGGLRLAARGGMERK